jgi:hypothetical protein
MKLSKNFLMDFFKMLDDQKTPLGDCCTTSAPLFWRLQLSGRRAEEFSNKNGML